jgi:hypothetical protein
MTRWSLRRRHPRAAQAHGGTRRLGTAAVAGDPRDIPVAAPPPTSPGSFTGATDTGFQATALPANDVGPWPAICEQFALNLLVLAEQMRASLDELEADEADQDRLQSLYRVDHAVTKMRRMTRDLRTLAARGTEDLAGPVTSILDVIRMAQSGIDRYTQVTVGRVCELAVLGYAADDVASLLAALLDNATRYSPGIVTVGAHLIEDGSVMLRVEDTGIGIAPMQVDALNAAFAGPIPETDENTGRHSGFPVAHRLAARHGIRLVLSARPGRQSGMLAMVTLPPQMLCEIPLVTGLEARQPSPPQSQAPVTRPVGLKKPQEIEVPSIPERVVTPGELPRRESMSLRGRRRDAEPAPVRQPGGERSVQDQATAHRAFADDVSAFALGAEDSGQEGTVP